MSGQYSLLPSNLTGYIPSSYDLELDKRLAEETTVLVENYTVRSYYNLHYIYPPMTITNSSQMDV
jgi:hypothetical protein